VKLIIEADKKMNNEHKLRSSLKTRLLTFLEMGIPRKGYSVLLKKLPAESCSMLDIGVGKGEIANIIRKRKNYYMVGIDLFKPYLMLCKRIPAHDDYILADARNLPFRDGSFDVCLAFDVIEHLNRNQGIQLAERLERIALEQVVIFTPMAYVPQRQFDGNIFLEHKSGYLPFDFESRGYTVKGINGFRFLKGERGQLRFGGFLALPALVISLLSRILVYNYPRFAFHMLCIKNLMGIEKRILKDK
jgi:SAM-dependent methyltransferase